MVVLPGGLGGSKRLAESPKVKEVLEAQEKAGRYVAAVCAAPSALLAHGIAKVNCKSTFSKTKDSIKIASELISHK